MMKNIKYCKNCQEPFEKPITCSKKEWRKRMYCSNSCANKVNALNNGIQFKKGCVSSRKGKKFPEFSGENNPMWKGGEIDKMCKYCGKKYRVRKYREYSAKYCSRECAWKGKNKHIASENENIRRGSTFKIWRKSVFEKDDYVCQYCGKIGGELNAHHIKNFSQYPELRFAIDNGITLCRECHYQFHKEYGFRNNTEEQIMNYLLLNEMLATVEEA